MEYIFNQIFYDFEMYYFYNVFYNIYEGLGCVYLLGVCIFLINKNFLLFNYELILLKLFSIQWNAFFFNILLTYL